MVIKLEKDVVFHYNEKEQTIHLTHLDDIDEDFLYSVKGWFGEKLFKFLNSDRNLKRFLQNVISEEELREIFKRLLATLIEQKILVPLEEEERSILSSRPFTEEEYTGFGTKNFSGSLIITKFKEVLAYAHGSHTDGSDVPGPPFYTGGDIGHVGPHS